MKCISPAPVQRHRQQPQRGVTLIEALVALMVMSFGMVALVGLLVNLRSGSDIAKQRSEAMRLAQAHLAAQRAFSAIGEREDDPANWTYYDDIERLEEALAVTPEHSNTSFSVEREVLPLIDGLEEPQAKTVEVKVSWKDRGDESQSLRFSTIVSRTDPAFSGAVGLTPPANGVRMPDARHPAVPVAAKDLDKKISAFRPVPHSSTVWVFNNRTGIIVGKCSIEPETAVSALTVNDVESCKNNTVGYLVAGTIRFSTTNPANPSAPEAMARPLTVGLNLTSSEFTTLVKGADGNNVEVLAPGGEYPISPNHECFSDAPSSPSSTQAFVNYNCIVYPNNQSPRNWWGQVLLSGLQLGTTAADFKVCRYSADHNGNGRIDNEEHPASYRGVSYSLVRQNFLVVRGDVACPTAPAVNLEAGVFIDYSTVQLQPAS